MLIYEYEDKVKRNKKIGVRSTKFKREKVKEVLLSFRRSLQNVGSKCTESRLTTFDHI